VVAGHVIHAMTVTKHIVVPQRETTTEIAFATTWRPINALLKGDCRWCVQGLGQEFFLNGCQQLLSCNRNKQPIFPLFLFYYTKLKFLNNIAFAYLIIVLNYARCMSSEFVIMQLARRCHNF
jgi:hypothetical protein